MAGPFRTAWALALAGLAAGPAMGQRDPPKIDRIAESAFHHVIAAGENRKLLAVVTAPGSVLWVAVPDDDAAARMRIGDADMTVRADTVRFPESHANWHQFWDHTGRRVHWEKPVPTPTGLRLALSDFDKPFAASYKPAFEWEAPERGSAIVGSEETWKHRVWAENEKPPGKARAAAPAPGPATETAVTVDGAAGKVRDSYRLDWTKDGPVVEVQLSGPGLVRDTVALPFAVPRAVRDAVAARPAPKRDWEVTAAAPGADYCLPVDDRTALVLCRTAILRAALKKASDRLDDQLETARRPAPPYDVFLEFEKAHRSANLLLAVLEAERVVEDRSARLERSALKLRAELFRRQRLWASAVPVPLPGGAARDLLILFPKGAAEHRSAPTHAVLHGHPNGRLGTLRLDGNSLILELDAELALDPLVHARANAELARTNHRVGGLYRDWTLTAADLKVDGLRSVRVTAQTGDRLALALELEADRASPVLWRLASPAGLPLRFRWKTADGSAGEFDVPVSLGRRTCHPVSLVGGKLTNAGGVAAVVEYVRAGDRFLTAKQPGGVLLLPGQAADVARFFDVTGADVAKADLPATAVAAGVGNPLDEFAPDEGLTETFRVRNLVPAAAGKGPALRFVEATVVRVHKTDAGPDEESRAGPFKLSPAGAAGSEWSVSFLRRGQGAKYRVEAKAYFDDGGVTTLKPVVTEAREANLTPAAPAAGP